MSTNFEEFKAAIDDLNKLTHGVRQDVEVLKSGDPLDDERIRKMADDTAQHAQSVQDLNTSLKAEVTAREKLEAQQEALERLMSRVAAGKSPDGPSNHDDAEAAKALRSFAMGTGEGGDRRQVTLVPSSRHDLSTDVNPSGGYLVQPETLEKTIDRFFRTSPMRMIADVIQTAKPVVQVLIEDGEYSVGRASEGGTPTSTTEEDFGIKYIRAHKYDSSPAVTQEMLDDSDFDIESRIFRKGTRDMTRAMNTDFVLGAQNDRAVGFLTYAAWATAGTYERDKLEQVNLGNASALTSNGLIDLQGTLNQEYQQAAVFCMKQETYSKALQLKGADQYHFAPTLLRDGQATPVLLGKPVYFMDDMPAVAANALAVAYGDFETGYTIVDRVGLVVIRDVYTSKGAVTFYMTLRSGGDVTSFESIKIGKVAA
jgi:HK97 family phage major capsid protein